MGNRSSANSGHGFGGSRRESEPQVGELSWDRCGDGGSDSDTNRSNQGNSKMNNLGAVVVAGSGCNGRHNMVV